jgi:hypothetical protein
MTFFEPPPPRAPREALPASAGGGQNRVRERFVTTVRWLLHRDPGDTVAQAADYIAERYINRTIPIHGLSKLKGGA